MFDVKALKHHNGEHAAYCSQTYHRAKNDKGDKIAMTLSRIIQQGFSHHLFCCLPLEYVSIAPQCLCIDMGKP